MHNCSVFKCCDANERLHLFGLTLSTIASGVETVVLTLLTYAKVAFILTRSSRRRKSLLSFFIDLAAGVLVSYIKSFSSIGLP